MTSHAVTLRVTAPVSVECRFWPEDDGWSGAVDACGICVRGSSFEEAKQNMQSALASRIEAVLRASTELQTVKAAS
jgi:predicted RNase H-like HicB family nuclease